MLVITNHRVDELRCLLHLAEGLKAEIYIFRRLLQQVTLHAVSRRLLGYLEGGVISVYSFQICAALLHAAGHARCRHGGG